MHVYIVKEGDQATRVARELGILYHDLMVANRGRKDLRQKIIGKDMQTGQHVTEFLGADWKEGARVWLPKSYRPGRRSSGATGDSSGQTGAAINWWCWNHPEFKACMDGSLALAQQNCGAAFAVGTPEYDACVSQAQAQAQSECINWCNQNYPTDPNTPQGTGPNPPATDCSNASLADICNPAGDCYDPAQCAAKGGQPQSNFCSSTNMIKTVQQKLGVTVDGLWGCQSQTALDKSQQTFEELAGPCQPPVPHKSGCAAPGPYVPPPCKNAGGPCSKKEDCCGGLDCKDGKCASALSNVEPGKKTPWGTYVAIGLGLAAAVAGVAYVSGDKKDSSKKRAAA